MHFFCFLNILLATKLSEWRLFWVQNENGRGGLDFCATTSFFSKINVTFLDVWMIFIEVFDISVSFRFQNFPQTNFSRYGGLYGSGQCAIFSLPSTLLCTVVLDVANPPKFVYIFNWSMLNWIAFHFISISQKMNLYFERRFKYINNIILILWQILEKNTKIYFLSGSFSNLAFRQIDIFHSREWHCKVGKLACWVWLRKKDKFQLCSSDYTCIMFSLVRPNFGTMQGSHHRDLQHFFLILWCWIWPALP